MAVCVVVDPLEPGLADNGEDVRVPVLDFFHVGGLSVTLDVVGAPHSD